MKGNNIPNFKLKNTINTIKFNNDDDMLSNIENDSNFIYKDPNTPKSLLRNKNNKKLMNLECEKSLTLSSEDDGIQEDYLKYDCKVNVSVNKTKKMFTEELFTEKTDFLFEDNIQKNEINFPLSRENNYLHSKIQNKMKINDSIKYSRTFTNLLANKVESLQIPKNDIITNEKYNNLYSESYKKGYLDACNQITEDQINKYKNSLSISNGRLTLLKQEKRNIMIIQENCKFSLNSVYNSKIKEDLEDKINFRNCAPYKSPLIKDIIKKIKFKITCFDFEINNNYRKKQVKSKSSVSIKQMKFSSLEISTINNFNLIKKIPIINKNEAFTQSNISSKEITLLEDKITKFQIENNYLKERLIKSEQEFKQELESKINHLKEEQENHPSNDDEIIPELLSSEQTFKIFINFVNNVANEAQQYMNLIDNSIILKLMNFIKYCQDFKNINEEFAHNNNIIEVSSLKETNNGRNIIRNKMFIADYNKFDNLLSTNILSTPTSLKTTQNNFNKKINNHDNIHISDAFTYDNNYNSAYKPLSSNALNCTYIEKNYDSTTTKEKNKQKIIFPVPQRPKGFKSLANISLNNSNSSNKVVRTQTTKQEIEDYYGESIRPVPNHPSSYKVGLPLKNTNSKYSSKIYEKYKSIIK